MTGKLKICNFGKNMLEIFYVTTLLAAIYLILGFCGFYERWFANGPAGITVEKKYCSNVFQGDHEIVSLTGTINTMNGEYYSHIHMSAANVKGEVVGGHLNRAIVSVTCEMIITIISGRVDRKRDENIGINLFEF